MQTKPLVDVNPLLNSILLLQNPSDNAATKAITIEAITKIIPAKYFVEEDYEGNLLFDNRPRQKRDTPVPTIVAHLDQVHDYARGMRLALIGNGHDKIVAYDYRNRRVGTGGDDKCGVYVAVQMLMSSIPCRVILTQDEEIGCVGAREVSVKWGELSSILLQADRRGNNDLIFHTNGIQVASKELTDRVLALPECAGMKPEYGSVTDIGDLAEIFEVSAFNISAGYYNAHMDNEWIMLSELEKCLTRVMAIATMIGGDVQELPPTVYSRYGRGSYQKYSAWDDDDEFAVFDKRLAQPAFRLLEGRTYLDNSGHRVGPMISMEYQGVTVYMEEDKCGPNDEFWLENGRCTSGKEDDDIDVTQL
jgi:tripeptide aminopeptidase